MAIKAGITGGIGSGKSVVCRLLELMGVPVYISDMESKRLTNSDPLIRKELIALLGEEIYSNEGLNKALLASYLFESPKRAAEINHIIHPRVREDFRRWAAVHADCPLLAIESAILIEAGFTCEVDVTVMVYSPLELRVERVAKRNNLPRELILQRIQSQMCDEEKKKQADYILLNDGETPLIPQVEAFLRIYSRP